MTIESTGTPILYLGFTVLVIALIVVDFLVLKVHGAHRVGVKEAAGWSVAWIAIALAFCGWFWWYLDGRFPREVANEKALEYLTGYLIENSLAIDNVFVWITLFNFFAVPQEFQKFIGVKMLLLDFYKIPVAVALGSVALILLASVVASLLVPGGADSGAKATR